MSTEDGNLVLTPEEKIECELLEIKITAELIPDLDMDAVHREAVVYGILDSVESIKKALSELAAKNRTIANT